MKIVTAHTMQELDRRAINEYGIPGRDLMEQAGRGCAEHILAAYGTRRSKRVVILAGKGNNGGDGYVIAHCLLEKEWQMLVIVLATAWFQADRRRRRKQNDDPARRNAR